jgi:hypothetical protein
MYSCSFLPDKNVYSNEELERGIKEAIASGDDELIVANLTDFQWDSLLILAPYTWIDDCEERFNLDCSPIEHSGIQHLDDRCVIVFLHDGVICEMVESIRHPGDFVPSVSKYFSPEEANFRIVNTDQQLKSGETWIELVQKDINYP